MTRLPAKAQQKSCRRCASSAMPTRWLAGRMRRHTHRLARTGQPGFKAAAQRAMAEAGFFYHSIGRESGAPPEDARHTEHPTLPDDLIRHVQTRSVCELDVRQETN